MYNYLVDCIVARTALLESYLYQDERKELLETGTSSRVVGVRKKARESALWNVTRILKIALSIFKFATTHFGLGPNCIRTQRPPRSVGLSHSTRSTWDCNAAWTRRRMDIDVPSRYISLRYKIEKKTKKRDWWILEAVTIHARLTKYVSSEPFFRKESEMLLNP